MNAMPRPRRKAQPVCVPALREPLATELTAGQLLQRFRALFSAPLLARWLRLSSSGCFYDRAYTPLITLWYFVCQQVWSDHTLARILADAFNGGADALSPRGKRLSRQLKSTATAAYSDARKRLPLGVLQQALRHSATEIRSWTQSLVWRGWNVVLVDGSTVRLRPLGTIPKRFPPHPSRSQTPYWCLMRVMVGFCARTGVVLGSAMAAVSVGEQALLAQLLPQLPSLSLIVGDRNLGVFSVVQAAAAAQVQTLLRLTAPRARQQVRAAGARWGSRMDLAIEWVPTRQDQTDPRLARRPVAGRLLALPTLRRGFRAQTIYLFTTLTDADVYPAAALLDLYGARWQVELNLRFVKTQMELGALECQSADMAEKAWLAGLLGYNLVRSLMVAAAARATLSVQALSFSRARQFLQSWIARGRQPHAWENLLDRVGRCQHPRRKKPRPTEPRAIRPYRKAVPILQGSRAAARKNLPLKS